MKRIINLVLHCSANSFGNVDKIRSWHLEKGWKVFKVNGNKRRKDV